MDNIFENIITIFLNLPNKKHIQIENNIISIKSNKLYNTIYVYTENNVITFYEFENNTASFKKIKDKYKKMLIDTIEKEILNG